MQKYSLYDLIDIFEKQANDQETLRKLSLEVNPDCAWAKDQFDIAQALHDICMEIQDIKNKLNQINSLQVK